MQEDPGSPYALSTFRRDGVGGPLFIRALEEGPSKSWEYSVDGEHWLPTSLVSGPAHGGWGGRRRARRKHTRCCWGAGIKLVTEYAAIDSHACTLDGQRRVILAPQCCVDPSARRPAHSHRPPCPARPHAPHKPQADQLPCGPDGTPRHADRLLLRRLELESRLCSGSGGAGSQCGGMASLPPIDMLTALGGDLTNLPEAIPPMFLCPLTMELMTDPVVTPW